MVSMAAPGPHGNHRSPTYLTGKTVIAGVRFVITFFILFPFVLTVHGVFPPKGKFGFPFGRNAEILRLPPGQRTISCLTYFFKKRCSFFCFAVSSLFAVMIPPCGQLFKYPAHWCGLPFPFHNQKSPSRLQWGSMAGTCGNRTHLGSSSPPATVLKTAGHTSTHLLPNA